MTRKHAALVTGGLAAIALFAGLALRSRQHRPTPLAADPPAVRSAPPALRRGFERPADAFIEGVVVTRGAAPVPGATLAALAPSARSGRRVLTPSATAES